MSSKKEKLLVVARALDALVETSKTICESSEGITHSQLSIAMQMFFSDFLVRFIKSGPEVSLDIHIKWLQLIFSYIEDELKKEANLNIEIDVKAANKGAH